MPKVAFDLRKPEAIGVLLLILLMIAMSGCASRKLTMAVSPYPPKQGDLVDVTIDATDADHLVRVDYTIGSTSGTVTTVPTVIAVDTCKSAASYPLTLPLSGQAVYDDGEVKNLNNPLDLTVGWNGREDNTRTFDVYVAHNGGQHGDVELDMAAKFKSRFDAYTLANYYWAEERFYTPPDSYLFANGHDLTLSFGHGRHHEYCYYHGDGVDLSQTAYGNFTPCGLSGDAEYLAFAACNVLNMDDVGQSTFWDFWFHTESTKHQHRPFTGLHQVLGFRTNFQVTAYHWGYWRTADGKAFVRQFANKMDQGWHVRDAWIDAAADELRQRKGKNMAAVLYHSEFGDDTVFDDKDDYIYPHAVATNSIITYLY